MVGILLTVAGHIAYGTTNVLWKNPRNELGTLPLIIVRSFACMIIFAASYFILTAVKAIPTPTFTWIDIVQTMGICAVNYFGLFFYLKAMKHAPVANTIGFGKIGLVLGIAIGYFVYGEEVSLLKIVLCAVVLIGISMIEAAGRKSPLILSKGLIYTILCKVFWATAYFYVPFINKLGPILFCVVLEFTVCTMSCILYRKNPLVIGISSLRKATKIEIALLIVLGTLGTFCLNFALANISIVLFAVIGLIEPILGLLISKFYHREQLSSLQKIGIAAGIVAAFVLALTK